LEIPILPQNNVAKLWSDVQSNISSYSDEGFQIALQHECKFLKGTLVPDNLSELMCYDENINDGILDAKNSIVIYKSLKGLTPYQARDERILAAISHIFLTKFAFFRHKISQKDKLQKIQRHFFARSNAGRDIERNNVAGRLWWHGYFVDRCREKNDLDEFVYILCSDTDFRQSIIERPAISKVPQVALAVMLCKKKFDTENPKNVFFKGRGVTSSNRKWYKMINLAGGSNLYAAMSSQELFDLFWRYMNEAAD